MFGYINIEVGDVCNVSAGGDAPKDAFSKTKTDSLRVPVISNGIGENALYGYTDIEKISVPAVTVAARGTIGYAEYRNYAYYPIIRLLSLIPKGAELDTKYLYYCLEGRKYSVPESGIPQLTVPMIKKEVIALPPLSKQKEIVKMLDYFEKIVRDMTYGIPAEIEARHKQYDYYRDKLLCFKDIG